VNDDDDVDGFDSELGFEPAVSVTGADPSPVRDAKPARARGPRSGLRRRLGAGVLLACALGAMGGGYAVFASSSSATTANTSAAQVAEGKQLYEVSCITCHGANLQGVKQQGVSLVGVGSAAVYFQVVTGRMPATGQAAEQERKTAKFTDAQTRALAAYVQSVGGGPEIPTGPLTDESNVAMGGQLFRLNCASCHGVTGKGAPLSAGKVAPSLNDATALEIYTAMLSGPENMPVFSNNEITPAQKQAVVSYIRTLMTSADPGGAGIDRIGPVSEAIVLWVGGVGVLMIAILWIGAKVQ
jgi:ubiquinol-cytochrome c reductase cytochrome c subunit